MRFSASLKVFRVLQSVLLGVASPAAGLGLVLLGTGAAAKASPIMSVSETHTLGDYDESHPGDELVMNYTIGNISDPGAQNNMLELTIDRGSSNGAYDALGPDGWIVSILSNKVVFNGNGNVLAPGQQDLFRVWSSMYSLDNEGNPILDVGYANAISRGPPPESFAPVQTYVIPEPSSLAIMALGLSGLLMKKRDK